LGPEKYFPSCHLEVPKNKGQVLVSHCEVNFVLQAPKMCESSHEKNDILHWEMVSKVLK
jgi:hypothetical protein